MIRAMQSPPAPGTPAIPQIAILGGGIGGLAAAAFLHRAGLPCTVYEQAAQLTEIGAGVVVAPNAARCEDLYGEHTYTAHRADLLGVLRSAVPRQRSPAGARRSSGWGRATILCTTPSRVAGS
jgi:salicylate hydroxylase